ncbi:hypothetical protein GYMLUDRAFT_983732 [Collybiopsis luxurians FD-317 M1]|uniref:NADP-dependent oxidoreductase domain-containing protein n=1 Tax=Collybiopsis luxurians FD-317 M1 TaxID=944289 RepID=A0A0D0BN53_9AGAR|nr:hypothetical protein GYMLUDRAFT_983732 [Collybiopsis luxurians FD-317 M1]
MLLKTSGCQFHYDTPIEETMQALHDVVKAGYVCYIGISSSWAYQCEFNEQTSHLFNMNLPMLSNNLALFISMQNHYSLVYWEEEREMFPMLKVRDTDTSFGSQC